MKLSKDYKSNQNAIESAVGYGKCYDVKKRSLIIGQKSAYLYYISSLSDDLLLERIIYHYQTQNLDENDIEIFASKKVSYGDVSVEEEISSIASSVLNGVCALIIEGFDKAVLSDTRSIPSRGIEEPENDHILRGARDGFCEILKINVAVMRRRLRTPKLMIEKFTVGESSKTDIAIFYIDGRADSAYVEKIRNIINSIKVDALTMAQETLAECMFKGKWINPFPKFRYTERPDAACATLLEGNLIILCDNSPQAMLLPVSIFDFLQESDDYCFPPLIGTYLRFIRGSIFFVALFLSPVWYLLVKNPTFIPSWLEFIKIEQYAGLPIFIQLLLIEFMIDGLRLASLNTPSSLGNSLSVVAGLIIGDFAVDVGWFLPEVILYMSFVAIANFTQPSFELGYAFKFMRIILLICVASLNVVGFALGVAFIAIAVACNRTIDGSRGYLYPLIPFDGKVMMRQVFRTRR